LGRTCFLNILQDLLWCKFIFRTEEVVFRKLFLLSVTTESRIYKLKSVVCPLRSSPSPTSAASGGNSKKPPPPPKRHGSTLTSSNQADQEDQIKIYNVEDTPVDLSNNTSFSDLTVDEGQGSGRVSVDSNDGLIQHHSDEDEQQPYR
jgi:hypothetical protein